MRAEGLECTQLVLNLELLCRSPTSKFVNPLHLFYGAIGSSVLDPDDLPINSCSYEVVDD
jgi:hypothetical protein